MIQVSAKDLGRKFGQEWIFRGFSEVFRAGEKCAIVGNNGSGKSTLLKILSGCQLYSKGSINYSDQGQQIPADQIYRYISLVAPYTVLPEELTPIELLKFMRNFREFSFTDQDLIREIRLWTARHKPIKYFSSGMKQRLQLGLAFYSDARILLLDEPTSNLDQENTDWYLSIIEQPMSDQIVLISSNEPREYACCSRKISMSDFKSL